MKKMLFVAGLVLGLSGCVTAPAYIPLENSRDIALSKDEAWANLVEYFASSNISIRTVEKDSGILTAERVFDQGYQLSSYADCGAAAMAAPISGSADLNVFVRETASGVKATVNARYHQRRVSAWDGRVTNTQCSSLGTLERAILNAIAKR